MKADRSDSVCLRDFDRAREVLRVANSTALSITKFEASQCFSAILSAAKLDSEVLHPFRKNARFCQSAIHVF